MKIVLMNSVLMAVALLIIITRVWCDCVNVNYLKPVESFQNCEVVAVLNSSVAIPDNDHFLCYNTSNVYDEECMKLAELEDSIVNGDANFCKKHHCTISAKCYCRSQRIKHTIKANCKNGWFNTQQLIVAQRKECFNAIIDPSTPMASPIVYSAFDPTTNNLRVRSSHHQSAHVMSVVKQDSFESQLLTLSNSDKDIPVSQDTKLITIATPDGGQVLFHRDQRPVVSDDDYCNLGYCEFCNGYTSYGNCHASNFGYAYIIMILIATILSVVACFFLMSIISNILICARIVVKAISYLLCCAFWWSKLRKNEEKTAHELQDLEDRKSLLNDIIVESRETREEFIRRTKEILNQNKKKNKKNSYNDMLSRRMSSSDEEEIPLKCHWMVILFSLLLLINISHIDAQCSGYVTSTSDIYSCENFNATHTQCQTIVNVNLQLPGVGSTACVQIASNKSEIIGKMQITYVSLSAQEQTSLAYWTTDWQGVSTSFRECYTPFDQCPKSCQEYYNAPTPNPCDSLTGESLIYPGASGCASTCGCAGCGCFYCVDAMNFYRASVKPVGTPVSVFTFTSSVFTATFKATVDYNGQTDTFSFSTSQPQLQTKNLLFNLQGVFLNQFTIFSDKKLAVQGNDAKLVSANDANVLVAGSIGDVQAPDVNAFLSPHPTAYNIPQNFVSIEASSSGTTAKFVATGMSTYNSYPSFPLQYAGYTWNYDQSSHSIYSSISSSQNALVNVQSSIPWTFYQLKDKVCPSLTFVGLAGCFSCDSGATLKITGYSSCLAGTCILSSPSATFDPSNLYLSTTSKGFDIVASFSKSTIDEDVTVTCSGTPMTLRIKGILVEKSQYVPSGNGTDSNSGNGNSSPLTFGGAVPLAAGITIVIIIIVASIVIVGVIIFFILMRMKINIKIPFCDCFKFNNSFEKIK